MIDVIIVIVIRLQNHKCSEMENAFRIFKVSYNLSKSVQRFDP